MARDMLVSYFSVVCLCMTTSGIFVTVMIGDNLVTVTAIDGKLHAHMAV